jgi:hypothetical protein
MNLLEWLQEWYLSQCNGRWEHSYGIRIDTLDNPGWSVFINLKETTASNVTMPPYEHDLGDDDWMFCKVVDETFVGYGDPKKLILIMELFRKMVAHS